MRFHSLSSQAILLEEQADYRSATRLGQYRLSPRALYWPNGEYLPLSSVTVAEAGTGSLQVRGCCGLALPVPRVSVFFDGQKKNILFDSTKQIDRFLSAWEAVRS